MIRNLIDSLRGVKAGAPEDYSSNPPVDARSFSPGRAYWNRRATLARERERVLALSRAVNRPSDLSLYQFSQLLASTLDFAPDLILELGRGTGNSLCIFAEAASLMPQECRVVSLCLTDHWRTVTVPRLKGVVPQSWFNPIQAVEGDLLQFDFAATLAGAGRVLLFWDAHGFQVAECVLGHIVPLMAAREHLVFMHDMSDTRYLGPHAREYNGKGLWTGENAADAHFRIGIVSSPVAQAISVIDFTGRNGIELDSADHSIDLEIGQAGRAGEMRQLLGEELFSTQAHWFYFTLRQHSGPYTFPHWTPPKSQ